MKIHNIDATGSFTYNGVDLSNLTGSTSDSGSFSTQILNLNQVSSSLNSFTSSINTTIKSKLDSESVISGSIQVSITGTTGYSTFSSSVSNSIGSLSGSVATTTSGLSSSIGSLSSSVATTTSDLSSSVGSLSSSVATNTSGLAGRITTIEGNYATTGSNAFIGTQTITGSLYISSDLVVQGSSSLQDITASAVNIGANIVNLNTANPAIRFAGLNIFDSGSIGGSGSFLYDAVQDEFIFVHRGDNSNITSSVALMGPETYNNVGNEIYPTANRILKGTGNEHIGDSIISETGGGIGISGSLSISGSIVATGTSLISGSSQVDVLSTTNIARLATTGSNTFSATITATGNADTSAGLIVNNPSGNSGICQHYINFTAGATTIGRIFRGNGASGATANGLNIDNFGGFQVRLNQLGGSGDSFNILGGNVGIGTTLPNQKLTVWTPSTTGLQTALRLNNPFGFDNINTGAQIVFSQDRSVNEDLKQGIIAVGQADAGTSATSFMAFYTNNTGLGERLRITSTGVACFSSTVCAPSAIFSGCVGVGTTSAYTSRLNVQGTSASLPAIKAGFGATAANGYTILGDNYTLGESLSAIGVDYSSGGLVLGSLLAPSTTTQGAFISTQAQFGSFGSAIRLSTSGEMLFYRGTQDSVISTGNAKTATVSLFINNTGNVGIGSTSPCGRLHIQGSGAGGETLLYLCSGGSVNTKFAYHILSGADDAFILRRSHTTQGELCIMSWTYQGRVGIGTITPEYPLHIYCCAPTGMKIQTCGSSFGSPSLNLLNGGVDTVLSATNSGLEIGTWSANNILFKTTQQTRATIFTSGETCFSNTVCAPIVARCGSKWQLNGSIDGGNNACALVINIDNSRAVRVRGMVTGIGGQTMTSLGMYEAIVYRLGGGAGNESKRFAVLVDCNASPGNGQGIKMDVVGDTLYIQNKTSMSYSQSIVAWAEIFYA